MGVQRLIVTGDDFGLTTEVNEAIEAAHCRGILSAASLMVSAPAAKDAIERAKRLPRLGVGLHLTLVNGRPLLPPERVPDLLGFDGRFMGDLGRAGVRFFFSPRARKQLALEIRAQFEAFHASGLALDHVNAHCHMHMHPTVLSLVIGIGREFGLDAIRIPAEPAGFDNSPQAWALRAWARRLRRRAERAGIRSNDAVLGLAHSGAMNEARVLDLLSRLPAGVSEMYFHPATRKTAALIQENPAYDYEGELAALLSPRVKDALAALGLAPVAYRDLGA